MQPTTPTTTLPRMALVGPLALALAPLATAQGWQSERYGPSDVDGLVRPLQLELTRAETEDAALLVLGGTPGDMAGLILGLERGELVLPGGQTLLVGAGARSVLGRFDGAGAFEHALAEVPEAFLDVPFHAQAFHVSSRERGRFALTLRLTVERVQEEEQEAEAPELPEPIFPPIMVDEIAGMIFAQDFEGAIDAALNSKGDEITFDLSGELQVPVPNPVIPTLAVGGKVAFKAKVARGEDSVNAVVYDLSIGSDVAATAGVSAGVAGAGAAVGQGGEVIWRYYSAEEVARAIKSMAILQATSQSVERACQLIDEHTAAARRALELKRQAENRVRGAFRSRFPARNNRLVQGVRSWSDERREARHEVVDQGVELLEDLVHLIADARTFLDQHMHGFEMRMNAEVSGSIGVGDVGDADAGGSVSMANFGANVSASIGRGFSRRLERVPETGGFFVEDKMTFTKKIAAGAGCVVGIEGEAQRVLELSHKEQVDADGYAFEKGGTTVKLTLDGKLAGALGLVVTGKAGVGGQLSVEMNLRDLLAYSADAAAIVLGDDEGKIVRLLRSVPIKAAAQAHYEAGIAVGIGVNLGKEYFKAGVGGSAMLKDVGRPLEYSGKRDGAALTWMLEHGPVRGDDEGLLARLSDVEAEVGRAMAWR